MLDRPHPDTIVVHAGSGIDPVTGAVAPPLVTSTIYEHGHPRGFVYGRDTNPTWERLEEVLSGLEMAAGTVVVGSGMAAIAAVLDLVPVGGHVVAPTAGYGGSRTLFRHLESTGRLRVTLVPIDDTDAVVAALRPDTALLHLETLTNPMLTVPDLDACAEAAHAVGALVSVDSTLTTPLLIRPLEHGADLVIHSLTKYVGGHSDLLAGSVSAADPGIVDRLRFLRLEKGGIPGQLEAWLALRGARTLALRIARQVESAGILAARLETHPGVTHVYHPSLGSHPQHHRAAALMPAGCGAVISVEVTGGAERAEAICAATRLWTHATSLGGVESLIERRGRYEADAEVCGPTLLRLSVGIEHVEDLWADLATALEATARLVAVA